LQLQRVTVYAATFFLPHSNEEARRGHAPHADAEKINAELRSAVSLYQVKPGEPGIRAIAVSHRDATGGSATEPET
jgi:hypothetical protein